MATQHFPEEPKKRSGALYFFLPIGVLTFLAIVNTRLWRHDLFAEVPNVDSQAIGEIFVDEYKATKNVLKNDARLQYLIVQKPRAYLYDSNQRKTTRYLLQGDTIWDFETKNLEYYYCNGYDREFRPYRGVMYFADLGNMLPATKNDIEDFKDKPRKRKGYTITEADSNLFK